jgi:CubicO group peptidase (beta-lactamase class C family)
MKLDQNIDDVFSSVQQSIDAQSIPGAALGIITRGGGRAIRVAGYSQIEPEISKLRSAMWFDLASLTKVIFTTQRCLQLVDAGKIGLDVPLFHYLPDLRQYDLNAAERHLTVRKLLSHETPLPAVEPLYTLGQDAETLRAYILQRDWPKGAPVYSDINFILLGLLIERITGLPLNDQTLPKGLSFSPPIDQSVATEYCTWRGRIMRGEVHDENAFALGGAAGHAGLFGTIDGVLDQALRLLNGEELSSSLMAEMMTPQFANRALGWEINHEGWHGGEGHSPQTIGHLGFTGTGLWIDHDGGYAWTLLTNRVHPSRHRDTGIMALRRETGRRIASLFKAQ